MSRRPKAAPPSPPELEKCPTGIHGLDVITGGGLPRGRPTLVCGGAGSGKTLIGMEFLVRGIQQHGEHGVFMSFEERATDLTENVASLGYDLTALTADRTHSNQARELVLSGQGVDLAEVFIGPDGGILTGSVRVAREAADRSAAAALEDDIARKEAATLRRRKAVDAKISEMQADIAAEAEEVGVAIEVQTSAASGRSTACAAQALEREQAGDPQTGRRNGARR